MGQAFISKLLFQPPVSRFPMNPDHLFLHSKSGSKLQVLYLNNKAKYTVIFSHGNAEDIYLVQSWLETYFLKQIHVNAVVYEYTGFGEANGRMPMDTSLYADIETVYLYLTDQLGIDPSTILAYGRSRTPLGPSERASMPDILGPCFMHVSNILFAPQHQIRIKWQGKILVSRSRWLILQKSQEFKALGGTFCCCQPIRIQNNISASTRSIGSGPSCFLAERYPLAGVILHSPIASALRVILDLRWTLPFDKFPNVDRVKHIACPVFVIHGRRDEIVPFKHAVMLHENSKVKYPPYYVDGAGHNNVEKYAGEYLPKIKEFLEYIESKEAGAINASDERGVGLVRSVMDVEKQ